MTDLEAAFDATRDKHGRKFMIGDVLKVFHFIGPRRKRFFMYKQISCSRILGGAGGSPRAPYFVVSHLNLDRDYPYYIGMNEGEQPHYEIIQGMPYPEDRPKLMKDAASPVS